ncbi:hypothetical protein [Candidatus Nitrosocosmicus hydrocola]|uniref:hypothetical protein n=1 Tax=Candidatus Nitrosocosmicus hydrocola TaxID=1826872 RepID=UPI0011E5A0D0|nr:hypothetical protein [Candidatus Nitrosocosmicus hydrocola]
MIERKIHYIKDRTENFDDYFSCRLKNCKLKYIRNWLRLFVDYHNKEITLLGEQSSKHIQIVLSYVVPPMVKYKVATPS